MAPGEVHALLGENGAGKSTLLKAISGDLAVDGGDIHISSRARMAQVLPFWGLSVGLVLLGPTIIRLMYDARYVDAGLILQIQVMGMMVAILYGYYSGVLMSMGRVDINVWLLAATVSCQMGGTLIGSQLGGHFGAIIGSSASVFGIYTVHSYVYRKLDIWFPRFDGAVMAASLAVMVAFYFSGRWRIGLAW